MATGRTFLAFLIAPLWAPLLMALFAFTVADLSHPADGSFFLFLVSVSAVFSYGGALLFGLPAFRLLVASRRTALWHAPLLGLIVAWITVFVFLTVFFPVMLGGWEALSFSGGLDVLLHTANLEEMIVLLACSGLVGILAGLTFWFIVRPDRVSP